MDSYELMRTQIEAKTTRTELDLEKNMYGVVTLHRPSNVDTEEILVSLVDALKSSATKIPLVLPLHPRTRKT